MQEEAMIRPMPLFMQLYYPSLAAFPRSKLYESLGWSDLTTNPAFADTCATRMSVALLRCAVQLPGARMAVKAGVLKGEFIEPGQANLSRILERLWGRPEKYRGEKEALAGIKRRTGVISFYNIQGGRGGHIDIIGMGNHDYLECASACYFTATEVWFWEL
jgi:hypothetical protein